MSVRLCTGRLGQAGMGQELLSLWPIEASAIDRKRRQTKDENEQEEEAEEDKRHGNLRRQWDPRPCSK